MEEPLETVLHKLQLRFPKIQNTSYVNKCHLCGQRKIVFGCFPHNSCNIVYCENCLKNNFREDIQAILEQKESWACPAKRSKCGCPSCSVKFLKVTCMDTREDVIQSALDYNAMLLNYLNTSRDNLTKSELDKIRKILIDNFKNLGKLADYQKLQDKKRNG